MVNVIDLKCKDMYNSPITILWFFIVADFINLLSEGLKLKLYESYKKQNK